MSFSVTTVICLATLAPSGADINLSRLIGRAFSKSRADIVDGGIGYQIVNFDDVAEGEDGSFPEQDDFRTMFGLGFSF